GDRNDAHIDAHLLRIARQTSPPQVDDAVQEHRQAGADGLCPVPQGDQRSAARLGRARSGRQVETLDRYASRRALRVDGATKTAGRGRAQILPHPAMSEEPASTGEPSMNGLVGPILILVLAPSAADKDKEDKPATPAKQYQALVKEYDDAMTAGSGARLGKVAARVLGLAEKHPKDPVAVDALIRVVTIHNGSAYPAGKDSVGGKALAQLLRDHLGSDKMGEVCRRISYGFRREYETFLRTVLEKNRHKEVRALARLSLAMFLDNRMQRVELGKERADLTKLYETLFGKDYLAALRKQDRTRA